MALGAVHRVWASVIEALLTSLAPRVLVEIGSDQAKNTRHLAEFSGRTGAVLHAIDPGPGFDFCAYETRYGPHFVFHRGTSLDSLPRVGALQAVLIDGAHNWHTVYGELTLIDTLVREQGQPFPLVLLLMLTGLMEGATFTRLPTEFQGPAGSHTGGRVW